MLEDPNSVGLRYDRIYLKNVRKIWFPNTGANFLVNF